MFKVIAPVFILCVALASQLLKIENTAREINMAEKTIILAETDDCIALMDKKEKKSGVSLLFEQALRW